MKSYMKQVSLLLTFSIIVSLTSNAQSTKDLHKFHALDGSEWVSKYDRDRKDQLIWDAIDLDLKAALIAGRLDSNPEAAKTYHDSFKKLFDLCRVNFERLRTADAGKEILLNPEFRYYLSENGVKVKNGITRSGEIFNFDEYARCFDDIYREYSFNSSLVKELANPSGKIYNVNLMISDFADRMNDVIDKMDREFVAMEFKESTVMRMVPRYEAAKQKAEALERQKAKKRRN